MRNWLDIAKLNLFPLSIEKKDFKKAKNEWRVTGEMEDLEEAIETCKLCWQENIRYQFEIKNDYTGNILLIGSECIKKFDIRYRDKDGTIMSREETKQKVNADKNKLIQKGKKKHVLETLTKLYEIDKSINFESFKKHYDENGRFTPNQLSLIVWKLQSNKIEHKKSCFKTTIKKDIYKDQLLEMEKWKRKKIAPYLTPNQRKSVNEYYKKLEKIKEHNFQIIHEGEGNKNL